VEVVAAINVVNPDSDRVTDRSITASVSFDFAFELGIVWVRFTPVPEPGTGILMGLGLLVMGVRTRRRA
jgi:hypothetical protein